MRDGRGDAPSFGHQRGHAAPEGQVHPLDKRGLEQRTEAIGVMHGEQGGSRAVGPGLGPTGRNGPSKHRNRPADHPS